MDKELIFDMDGTIADFYGVKGWHEKVSRGDVSPYVEAQPIYDTDTLSTVIGLFQSLGYHITIVTWNWRGASKELAQKVRKAKIDWLQRMNIPYDEVHVVKYGTPKQKYIKNDFSVLIDDNDKALESFLKSSRGRDKRIIDAKHNIMKQLIDLLVA